MRALHFDMAHGLTWHDDPEPTIQLPTDALVRPIAVSTCDLDQEIIHTRAVPGTEQPFAIGHEGVGQVVAVGDAVTAHRPGGIVVIPYHLSCGACDRCRDGLPLFCRAIAADSLAVFGVPVGEDYGGLFSDLVRVPFADHGLVRVPASLSPLDAVSVGDNLTDAYRVTAPFLRARPGSDVLIMNQGATGLYAADIARACGARRVRVLDHDPARLEIAAGLGAETSDVDGFDPDEHQYDLAIVATQRPDALQAALRALAPGGQCENLAFHFTDPEVPVMAMLMKCTTLRSALSNARPLFPDVLALLASGRITPQVVQTAVLPFDTAVEALPTAGFKPVLVRDPR